MEGRAKQLCEILKIGGSITFAVSSEMAMSLAMGVFAGLVGTREQSAMTYVNQFSYFNFLALAAFGQSCSQEVSRQIGAKKYELASKTGQYGLATTMFYTTPIPLFFAILPDFLMFSSKSQAEVAAILKILVPIMSAGIITDSARYNLLNQLRVLGDIKGSTIISVSGLSAGVALSAVLGLKTRLGIYGVAAGNTAGVAIATAGLLKRWHSHVKPDEIKKIAEQPHPPKTAGCLSRLFNKLCHRSKDREKLLVKQLLLPHFDSRIPAR